jgi:hypothetical protein
MATGELSEPISEAKKLMLGDFLRFTKAPLESNRTRDYKVVELRLDYLDGKEFGETVVEAISGDRFRYHVTDAKLVELGAEIVYRRVG